MEFSELVELNRLAEFARSALPSRRESPQLRLKSHQLPQLLCSMISITRFANFRIIDLLAFALEAE